MEGLGTRHPSGSTQAHSRGSYLVETSTVDGKSGLGTAEVPFGVMKGADGGDCLVKTRLVAGQKMLRFKLPNYRVEGNMINISDSIKP